MSVPEALSPLVGKWTGTNLLWFTPHEPAKESDSTASVALVGQGRFLRIDYDWTYENKRQEGMLLLGHEKPRLATVAWIDSFHNGDKIMLSQGEVDETGVSVLGAYAAPPGPDWGWRTVVLAEEQLHLLMYNITPDGEEAKAVEMTFARA